VSMQVGPTNRTRGILARLNEQAMAKPEFQPAPAFGIPHRQGLRADRKRERENRRDGRRQGKH
jgi:hypothetical protein